VGEREWKGSSASGQVEGVLRMNNQTLYDGGFGFVCLLCFIYGKEGFIEGLPRLQGPDFAKTRHKL
jgi:hypothetical protein